MNQNNEMEFATLMAGMSEAYGTENTKAKIEIYFQQLKEFSIEEIRRAVDLSLGTLKFFPKIAELRELIQGSPQDQAMLAWECLMDTMEDVGYYDSPTFEDWRIAWCVEQMGGWMYLCDHEHLDDLKFRQKEFQILYKNCLLRPELEKDVPAYLIGFFEKDNEAKGLRKYIPEPVFIECSYLRISERKKLKELSAPEFESGKYIKN